jgi:hypothetical protein
MNFGMFPTARNPYPTIDWPGRADSSLAATIDVNEASASQTYDFYLPPQPKHARISGTVIGIDGRPLSGVNVLIIALPDYSIAEDSENRPLTDAEGNFSFTAVQGFQYRVSATVYGDHSLHSSDLTVSIADSANPLILRLDRPGRFDQDPVH